MKNKSVITAHKFTQSGDPENYIILYGDLEKAKKSAADYPEPYLYTGTEESEYTWLPVADAICQALPGDWSPVPSSQEYRECGFHLTRADGLKLWWNHSRNGRGIFQIQWANPRNGGTHYLGRQAPRMNVSESKTPEQIAKEITRRILSDSEACQALALEKMAEETRVRDQQIETLKSICNAAGVPVPRDHVFQVDMHTGNGKSYNYDRGYGDAWVSEGGNVKFTLHSVPPASAVRIASLLKELFNS